MEGTVMRMPWRIIDSTAPEGQTKIKSKITLGKKKITLGNDATDFFSLSIIILIFYIYFFQKYMTFVFVYLQNSIFIFN